MCCLHASCLHASILLLLLHQQAAAWRGAVRALGKARPLSWAHTRCVSRCFQPYHASCMRHPHTPAPLAASCLLLLLRWHALQVRLTPPPLPTTTTTPLSRHATPHPPLSCQPHAPRCRCTALQRACVALACSCSLEAVVLQVYVGRVTEAGRACGSACVHVRMWPAAPHALQPYGAPLTCWTTLPIRMHAVPTAGQRPLKRRHLRV